MSKSQNFDDIYRRYHEYYSQPSDGLVACVRRYQLDPCPALDAGCGQGRNSVWLAENGFAVLAVDTSVVAIESLQRRALHLRLSIDARVADISTCCFEPRSLGLAVVQTTLNHLYPEDIFKSCKNISGALRPGGLLYCVVFTTEDPGFSGKEGEASDCAELVKYYFPPEGLRNAFADLEVLEYEEYVKPDLSHGLPHVHGKAKLIARAG